VAQSAASRIEAAKRGFGLFVACGVTATGSGQRLQRDLGVRLDPLRLRRLFVLDQLEQRASNLVLRLRREPAHRFVTLIKKVRSCPRI
jgi:hypothetical protein